MHRDVMDQRAWKQSAAFELLDASAIVDRLIGGVPITEEVELMLVMYRRRGEQPFGEPQRRWLRMVMAAVAGIGRRLALAHGLIFARRPKQPYPAFGWSRRLRPGATGAAPR